MNPSIEYRRGIPIDPAEAACLFDASGIVRPTKDLRRIARMLADPSLVVSAWHGTRLVGVARALTDYSYCCYLSDLAIDGEYQRRGIGRALVRRVQSAIGENVSLILMSAPDAMSYYPTLGFELASNAYLIRRRK